MDSRKLPDGAVPAVSPRWRAYRVIGVLVALSSIVSLTERVADVGLVGIFSDYITYYRALSIIVFGTIPNWLGIDLPQWLADLWAISFFGGATIRRAQELHYRYHIRLTPETFWERAQNLIGTLISGFAFIGFLPLIASIAAIFSDTGRYFFAGIKASPTDVWREVVLVAALAFVFFALNAFAVSHG